MNMTTSETQKMIPDYKVTSKVQMLAEVEDYNLRMMNIPEMWKITRGEGVKLVVLDTGLPKHVDLKPNTELSKSFIPGYLQDLNGHSTHCNGIIAAIAGNGIGIAGIAPDVDIICGAVLDADGSGSIDAIVKGIYWAVDEIQADIISMSLGIAAGAPIFQAMKDACDYAKSKGVAIFAASGNESGAVGQPAIYDSVFAVAAVNNRMEHASFSDMGPEVDFAAGGVDVYSTYLNNTYAKLSGTSMATPALAAVAALILAKHKKEGKKLTVDELGAHLQRIAYNADGDGFDNLIGYGIPIFQTGDVPDPDPTTTPVVPTPAPVTPPAPTTPGRVKKMGPKAGCAYWQMANEFLDAAVAGLDAGKSLETAIGDGLRSLRSKVKVINETLKPRA